MPLFTVLYLFTGGADGSEPYTDLIRDAEGKLYGTTEYGGSSNGTKAMLHLPSDEKYGLISQMRRVAVSIPANTAEGFKRRGQQDKAHFCNIAQASLAELRYLLYPVSRFGLQA